MVWTYDASRAKTSKRDAVRMLIGDTVECDPQMQDEEIDYLITQRGSLYGAAAECCRTLATRFARSVNQGAGGTQVQYGALSRAYTIRATDFETKAAVSGAGAMPYAGGQSIADKQKNSADADRNQPEFAIGMFDNYLPVPAAPTRSEDEAPPVWTPP